MIEVEQKFILSEGAKARLTKEAKFISKKVFTDIYYDTADYSLTTKDVWLRQRGGKFELKIPIKIDINRLTNQYQEIEDEAEIRKFLHLSEEKGLEDDLASKKYSIFCRCTTVRKKYGLNQFIIDLDEVDYGDFKYNLGEIELMINSKEEMALASEKILALAKEKGLELLPVRGKVIEYLKQKRPQHYEVLVKAGVVKDF